MSSVFTYTIPLCNVVGQWPTLCGSMAEREKSGGGATRFKQHLAHRGSDVADCPSVPPDVKAYFIEQLERNKDKARERARQKLLRDAAARSSNVDAEQLGGEGYDEDEELQEALRHSRQEYEFMQQAGPRYERGGGSGSRARGSDVRGMFTRSRSHVPERVRDYHLGLSSAPRQQRIDTGPWTVKGRTKRELLGRAWAKACHAVGIPGRIEPELTMRRSLVVMKAHLTLVVMTMTLVVMTMTMVAVMATTVLLRVCSTEVLLCLLVRRTTPMPHKIQIMEHPYHNDRQDQHIHVVDRPSLHMIKIALAPPPLVSIRVLVSTTTPIALLHLQEAFCGHLQGP